MRVTWSYTEASKHPRADSRHCPAVPRLADCAASGRLLLLSGSLSLPAPHAAHSSAEKGSDQGLLSLHYEACIKVGVERGRGDGPQELSCPRVRTIPSGGTLLLLPTPPVSARATMRGTSFGLWSNCTTSLS